MTTRTKTGGQTAADILQEKEAHQAAIQSGRASSAQTWIAFGALMVTLFGLAGAGVFGYAQLIDKVNSTARDTETLKTDVRGLTRTVDRMAYKLKVDSSSEPESGLTFRKDAPWSAFASSMPTPSPLSSCVYEPGDEDSVSGRFLRMLALPSAIDTSKPSAAASGLVPAVQLSPLTASRFPYQTRLHW